MQRSRSSMPVWLLLAGTLAGPLPAQETLERTPNLSGGWTGQMGMLYANLPARFTRVDGSHGRELAALPALDFGLGLPLNLLAGLRFAPQSPVVEGHPTEWEVFGRYLALEQARGNGVDAATTLAWNGAAGSLDGELSLARWMGPLRLIGAFRTMSDAFGSDDARVAVAGGAVLHPRPGGLPLALVGDVAVTSNQRAGEGIAWSAGVQIGASFTDHTLSVFATNTASPTLQGGSRGDGTVRFGVELTVPIPVARFAGWVLPREEAAEAVIRNPDPVESVVRAEIARYLFAPKRIEISAGTTIEWVNLDDAPHTVNAEDGSWNSGTIRSGEIWRARFDRPGRYLFYCGPHPFMKGEVVVR